MDDEKAFISWESASTDTIDVKRCYIDIAGDLATGILLSQIIYWFLPSRKTGARKTRVFKEGRRWIAKTRKEFWEECRVSERQCDRGLKILEDKGIITRKIWKFSGDPTAHIAVNFSTLKELVDQWIIQNQVEYDEDEIRLPPNAGNDSDETQVSKSTNGGKPYTENTAETTAKTLNTTSDSNSKTTGDTDMSMKGRIKPIAKKFFKRCDSDNSYVWKKLRDDYGEREAADAFYNWAEEHQGDQYNNPVAAFLGVADDYVGTEPSAFSPSVAKQRAHDLSIMVATYTVNKAESPVAFNDRQKKALQPACEQYDVSILFAAFKRFWDALPDKKAEQFAAKNFSEQSEALAAAEVVHQETLRKKAEDIAAMEEASRKAAEQVERELEEQKARKAEEAKLMDETVEF